MANDEPLDDRFQNFRQEAVGLARWLYERSPASVVPMGEFTSHVERLQRAAYTAGVQDGDSAANERQRKRL